MTASGGGRSSISDDWQGAPSIHCSMPQTKRSEGDSNARKDIRSDVEPSFVTQGNDLLRVFRT
jgi:hypothetical protein